MPDRKSPLIIILEPADQAELAHLVRSTTVPNGLTQRAQIILQLAAGASITHMARQMGCNGASCATGAIASANTGSPSWQILHGSVVHRVLRPKVAVYLVKMACERPDAISWSLSEWHCIDLARQLEREDIVEHMLPETIRRILVHHATATTLACQPACHAGLPNQGEDEYKREGALDLFAGFDTRTGRVYGQCYERKRPRESIAFSAYLDAEIPAKITTNYIIYDNAPPHHAKQVREWLKSHPRLVLHFTPVHCSWLNQVAQWFSIHQRKRLRIVEFASKAALRAKLMPFIAE